MGKKNQNNRPTIEETARWGSQICELINAGTPCNAWRAGACRAEYTELYCQHPDVTIELVHRVALRGRMR